MASVSVTTTLDTGRLSSYIYREIGGAVQKAGGWVRDEARAEITRAGRVDTGAMRQSITSETARHDGYQVTVRVTSRVPQARWQHEGTQQIIVPRRARVLRFRPKGGGPVVFARKVRGIWPGNPTEPLPFLTRPLSRIRIPDFL